MKFKKREENYENIGFTWSFEYGRRRKNFTKCFKAWNVPMNVLRSALKKARFIFLLNPEAQTVLSGISVFCSI